MFSSTPKLISVVFPDAHEKVFTASDVLNGHITLRLETEGKDDKIRHKLKDVQISLIALQVTTYAGGPGEQGNLEPWNKSIGGLDYRTENTVLYREDRLLWDASSSPLPDPKTPPPILTIPFSFTLPGPEMNLPPSFSGGSAKGRNGMVDGDDIARIVYMLELSGSKTGSLSFDEDDRFPFLYMPPSIFGDPAQMPPPIVPRNASLAPFAPPPPPNWPTATTEKEYKEKLFGKNSKVIIKFTTPPFPSLPRSTPTPYHLSILVLAPPSTSEGSEPSLTLPSPSDISLLLTRNVSSEAQRGVRRYNQHVGPLIKDLKTESRVWDEDPRWRDVEVEGGGGRGQTEKRWGQEKVIVGEFEIGEALVPTFFGQSTKGLLSCSYSLRLEIELKGPMNDLELDDFMPLVLSSNCYVGQPEEVARRSSWVSLLRP
ncbi:hypothetical protein BDY24DRAFT_432694 [Mrakia frigida]|uniref:uncharacterized protein n=1 Tax=Mrakia frigida TaxID=29902 RepID=UPI003FCC1995